MALRTFPSLSDLLSSLLPSKQPPPPPPPPSSSNLLSISKSSPSPLVSTTGAVAARPCQTLIVANHDDVIRRVAFPSLAHANLVFFKSGYYNVQVVVEDDEPEDRLLNRFRRSVSRAGVLRECRRRRFFESSQEKRKRKAKEAAKKNRKRRPKPKPKPPSPPESSNKKKEYKEEEEEDNWELPPDEVEIPYTNRF